MDQTMPEPRDVVLEVEGVTKRFPGVLANDDVNLTLRKGEILARLTRRTQALTILRAGRAYIHDRILDLGPHCRTDLTAHLTISHQTSPPPHT